MESKKILVVEDDINIAQLIAWHLTLEGYESEIAYTGEDAIEKIKTYSPHLIILDIMLPKVDGWQICQELKSKKETANIPVIIVTAKTQQSDIKKGWELGVVDYITKPFSPVLLTEVVNKILKLEKMGKPSPITPPVETSPTRIGIIGATPAGMSMLQFLLAEPRALIVGIADRDRTAPGMRVAEHLGIFSTTDIKELLQKKPQLLFDLSEDIQTRKLLKKLVTPPLEVLSGTGIKFVWELIESLQAQQEKERELLREINTRLKEISTLSEVAHLITSTLKLSELLEKAIFLLKELLEVSGCAILLKQKEGFHFKAQFGIGQIDTSISEENIIFSILQEREFIPVEDLTSLEKPGIQLIDMGFTSGILAPLKIKNKLIGCILLLCKKDEKFSEAVFRFLPLFSSEASIAIENAQLYTALEKQLQELELLYEGSKSLLESLDFETLMKSSGEIMKRYLHPDGITAILWEEETEEGIVYWSEGIEWQEIVEKEPFSFKGDILIKNVFEYKKPLVFSKWETEAPPHSIWKRILPVVSSIVAIPISRKEKNFGLILLASKHPREYTQEEIYFLATLSAQTATAIENAFLYESLKKKHLAVEQLLEKITKAEATTTLKEELKWALPLVESLKELKLSHQNLMEDFRRIGIQLEEMKNVLQSSLKISSAIDESRETTSEEEDIVTSLRGYLQKFKLETNIKTELLVLGTRRSFTLPFQRTVLQIIQEALKNVKAHSQAHKVEIKIKTLSDQLNVAINDDGVGFDDKILATLKPTQQGIKIMQDKVSLLGGSFKIKSKPGRGTDILFRIPIPS